MKSLDIPIVITPTLTLPPQEGEGNSRVSGWTLTGKASPKNLLSRYSERNEEKKGFVINGP